jgi:DNA polymerase bacteriophage-type
VTIDTSGQNTSPDKAIEAFCEYAYEEHGLLISSRDVIPGEIGRCKVEGREGEDGAFKFFSDGRGGWVQNWAASADVEFWFCQNGVQLSPEEREELQRAVEAEKQSATLEREAEHRRVQAEQRRRFDAAETAVEHPYLAYKKIAAYGLKVEGDKLLVPMRDADGELWNAQEISPDGKKHFPWHGKKKGLFHQIGGDPDGTLAIAEGYGTAASIHAATGHTVLVAFDRGNLKPVAEAMRRKWPKTTIIIAADDDHATERDKGDNPGTNDAMDAALAVNGKVARPDFTGVTRTDKQSDFNDLVALVGEDAVRRAFEAAKKPDDFLSDLILVDPPRVLRPWLRQRYHELRERNLEAQARLRAAILKTRTVRAADLDGGSVGDNADNTEEQEKETARQVDRLVSIAKSKAEFFHTPKQVPFADIRIKGIRETHPIRGKSFRRWLGYEYRQETGTVASAEALSNAIGALEGEAHYEGEERKIFIRIGGHEGKIYIDLGDPTWRAIEVDKNGWRTVSEPPVRFRRSDGAGVLPEPVQGGSVRDLRPFLNVANEAAFVIVVAWLVGALRDRGPYLILAVYGPGGSAKTCFAKLLRALVDPRLPETEGFPNDRETLILNASFAHVLAFDNISVIRPDMSDDLAKLATGTGLTRRTKFADEDQTIFDACLPLILNGIETFVIRGDLVSRTATLTLEEIQDSKRRTEQALFAEFEAKRPGILGALLDAVVNGLRQMPHMSEGGHRMADAYKWIAACETGAPWAKNEDGKPLTFKEALAADNEETALAVLATNRLAVEIRKFAKVLPESGQWEDTLGEFYAALNNQFPEEKDRKALERDKKWPVDAIRFSGALRRILPHLPYWGIGVTIGEHTREGRRVCLRKVPLKGRNLTSPTSHDHTPNEIKDLAEAPQRHPNVNVSSPEPHPAAGLRDDGVRIRDDEAPTANPLKIKGCDNGDDGDDYLAINGGTSGYDTDDDPDGPGSGGGATPPAGAGNDGDVAGALEKPQGVQGGMTDPASSETARLRVLYRDYETRSHIDLEECGAAVYAAHPTTDVWCCAHAVDDGEVKLWVPGDPTPPEFIEAASNPNWVASAFNCAFEAALEEHIMGPQYGWPVISPERHRCTMAQTLALALLGSLARAAQALGLENQKDAAGHRLMLQMSHPRRPRKGEDPNGIYWYHDLERRMRLYEYCRQDVRVEREMALKAPPLPPEEQAVWLLDQKINGFGFSVDVPLITEALRMMSAAVPGIDAELSALTGGKLTSVHQAAKMLAWLNEHGCELPDIRQRTIKATLGRKDLDPSVRRVLELREQGAPAAAKKLARFQQWRGADGRVRGTLQYHGASTGRWAGRGPQIQNLKRAGNLDRVVEAILGGEQQPLSVLGDVGRALIVAPPGHRLIGADFSGIESRVTAWLAGEEAKVAQWRKFDETGLKEDEPYLITGTKLGLEELTRLLGKVCDLAFGFSGGIGAFRAALKMYGVADTWSDDEVRELQQAWRNEHRRIVAFWHALNRNALAAVGEPGKVFWVSKQVGFKFDGGFLWMRLPSGRKLAYPGARLIKTDRGDDAVVFMDSDKGKWRECRGGQGAYGGIWIENAVQATARDLLTAAMLRLDAAGYNIIMTVHDEIVAEVPDGFGSEEGFLRILVELPDWAEGLPVAAKVWSGQRFSK